MIGALIFINWYSAGLTLLTKNFNNQHITIPVQSLGEVPTHDIIV